MSYEIEIAPNQGQMNEVVVQTIVVQPLDNSINTSAMGAIAQNMAMGQILHQCGQCDIYSLDKDILKRHNIKNEITCFGRKKWPWDQRL